MSDKLNRRAILAGAAAIPTLSLPIAATAGPAAADDDAATIARAEQMVALLSDCFVCDGWHEHFDSTRAAKFLEAVRTDKSDTVTDVIGDWVHDHGQSLDWLYLGDFRGLITYAAARSPAAASIPAVPEPAIEAAAEWRRAEGEWTKAYCELDNAEFSVQSPGDHCPQKYVTWRNYRDIRSPEIEEARDEFLAAPNADKPAILKEYAEVKAKYRKACKAERDWYKTHGLSKLKATVLRHERHYWRAVEALENARPTTVAGAVALIEIVHEFTKEGSTADFFEPVLENALDGLRHIA